ncbi:MAG: toll/interleukin-1 receptor domain-containing protein [Verrucomicrobiota bacterium]
MADVFISYSRKDKEFVQRLDDALRQREREAWVDWEGIRPTEEFMQAIYAAIEGADTFIFILSPDSVSSMVCGKEIAHALAQNKRMVPIVARDVNAAEVPEALAKLNWIFCRDSDDFAVATETLITALDTDLGWDRAHTRLLTRALEWEAKGKNSSFVLRGVDLRAAEQWLTEAGSEKERQPTPLQTAYIIASRKAAAKRQRITLGAVSLGFIVAIVLAVVAVFARQRAEKATAAAQEALTRSFVRTIGVSDDKGPSSPDERSALWELAELEPINAPVRERVIDFWLQAGNTLVGACRRNGQGLHAAIGLNTARRNYSSSKLRGIMGLKTGDALETDSTDEMRLEEVLPAVEMWAEPKDIGPIAFNLGKALATTRVSDRERLSRVSTALGELAARIEPKDATAVSEFLLTQLENSKKGSPYRLRVTVDSLFDLAARMESHHAAEAANRLIMVLENPSTTDAYRIWSCGRALRLMSTRMEAEEAASVTRRAAQVLVRVLEQNQEDVGEIAPLLGGTLAGLTAQSKGDSAASIVYRGALAMLHSMENAKDSNAGRSAADALRVLLAQTASAEVEAIADRLTKSIETPHGVNAARLSHSNEVLAAMAARFSPQQAATFASRLTRVIEDPQVADAARLSELSQTLFACAARMDSVDAETVAACGAERLAKALENSEGMDAHQRAKIGRSLGSLAALMEHRQAQVITTRSSKFFIDALVEPSNTDAFDFESLGSALAALLAQAEPASVSSAAERLVESMEDLQSSDVSRVSGLANVLAGIDAQSVITAVKRAAEVVIRVAQTPPEDGREEYLARLPGLGDGLASLAARLESKSAASIAARGGRILAAALNDPKIADSAHRSTLGWSLGGLCLLMTDASKTRLLALSEMLADNEFPVVSSNREQPERQFAQLCALLGKQDLAEVLKWPFSVGEPQKIALTEMEKKTQRKFNGNIWSFVEQAPAIGIRDIDAPAKRPRADEALAELFALSDADSASPN